MVKIDMDLPLNCEKCPFKEVKIVDDGNTRHVMYKCLCGEGVWIHHCDLAYGRHPDCPLKI